MGLLGRALVACALAAPGVAQEEARYEVSYYDVTLTLHAGSADADVELDITYAVQEGLKYDGFKYVGPFRPVDVIATDEHRGLLRADVTLEREYRIGWRFPPARGGSQRVIVRFRLPEVLSGTRAGGNELSAPWIGVFRVPVRHAAYTVVFPPGFQPEIRGRASGKFARRSVGGQQTLVLSQEPLTQRSLSLQFTPGLVDHRRPSVGGSGTNWPALTLLGLALVGVFGWLGRGRSGETGWSDGGCGGGGCGGGGCGGGCGG